MTDWLPTLLIVAGLFGLAVLGMSVGAMVTGRRIRGSCGGLGNLPGRSSSGEAGGSPCDLCSRPETECERREELSGAAAE